MNKTEHMSRRFERLYSGIIFDTMQHDMAYSKPFVLDMAIKPLWKLPRGQVLFGHAFTCKGQRLLHEADIDETVRLGMFQDFREGCIQVIDTDGDDTVAHFGDISGKIARKFALLAKVPLLMATPAMHASSKKKE